MLFRSKYENGECIADVEVVRAQLAEIYTKVESQRALTFDAARAYDSKSGDFELKALASRLNATENVIEICGKAMKLGGGIAYSKFLPLERYLRDSYASLVMSPTPDILQKWLGDKVVKI